MEDKYYLAIETKPNNYFPINLLDLNIASKNIDKLEELDAFTSKYSKEELINLIKEANLLEITDNMEVIVIYNEKNVIRKSPVLTKENVYNMWSYLKVNYEDKNFVNKIYNFLKNKIDSESLNKIKNTNNQDSFLKSISSLPYLVQRKLYFYLNE